MILKIPPQLCQSAAPKLNITIILLAPWLRPAGLDQGVDRNKRNMQAPKLRWLRLEAELILPFLLCQSLRRITAVRQHYRVLASKKKEHSHVALATALEET